MKKDIHFLIKNHKSEFNDFYKDLLKSTLPNNELSAIIMGDPGNQAYHVSCQL